MKADFARCPLCRRLLPLRAGNKFPPHTPTRDDDPRAVLCDASFKQVRDVRRPE